MRKVGEGQPRRLRRGDHHLKRWVHRQGVWVLGEREGHYGDLSIMGCQISVPVEAASRKNEMRHRRKHKTASHSGWPMPMGKIAVV